MWEIILIAVYLVNSIIFAFFVIASYFILKELRIKIESCDQIKRIMVHELRTMQDKIDSVDHIPLPEELKQMIYDVENLKDEIDKIAQKIKLCQIKNKNNKINK